MRYEKRKAYLINIHFCPAFRIKHVCVSIKYKCSILFKLRLWIWEMNGRKRMNSCLKCYPETSYLCSREANNQSQKFTSKLFGINIISKYYFCLMPMLLCCYNANSIQCKICSFKGVQPSSLATSVDSLIWQPWALLGKQSNFWTNSTRHSIRTSTTTMFIRYA